MRRLALVEQLNYFLDLELESVEGNKKKLNLVEVEIDEHSCDLGCLFFSDTVLNILVDELSNLMLVVRIVRGHSRGKGLTESQVLEDLRRDLLLLLLLLGSHLHLLGSHLRLSHHHGLTWHRAWVHLRHTLR